MIEIVPLMLAAIAEQCGADVDAVSLQVEIHEGKPRLVAAVRSPVPLPRRALTVPCFVRREEP